MSPIWGHAIGVFIVLLLLVFSGVWLWAWLPHHKKTFEALARLPNEDNQQ
jgi:cytochrome c oxidase cbb3-type subunit IV